MSQAAYRTYLNPLSSVQGQKIFHKTLIGLDCITLHCIALCWVDRKKQWKVKCTCRSQWQKKGTNLANQLRVNLPVQAFLHLLPQFLHVSAEESEVGEEKLLEVPNDKEAHKQLIANRTEQHFFTCK